MDKKKAFQIVLNELAECGLFMGKYDASHKKERIDYYMLGISTVMECIAANISDEVCDDYSDTFIRNMIESQRKAGVI